MANKPSTRLNTWTPLEAPWDTPMSPEEQEAFATSAVISGATPTDASVTRLLSDFPRFFVDNQRLAQA